MLSHGLDKGRVAEYQSTIINIIIIVIVAIKEFLANVGKQGIEESYYAQI